MNILEINHAMYGEVLFKLLDLGIESGIFEHISRRHGMVTFQEICTAFPKYNTCKLMRFLNASVSGGLLEKIGADVFTTNQQCTSLYLSESDNYIGAFLSHIKKNTNFALNGLGKSLQEKSDDIKVFDGMYENICSVRAFLDAMWKIGYVDAKEIVNSGQFRQYDTAVDIGGGSGSFSIAGILSEKIKKAIVFDLPLVEFYIKERAKANAIQEKIDFVKGDFFKDELPVANLYILGYILSDWCDEKCIELLLNISKIAPHGADVIILEKLFKEYSTEPFSTTMMDICMMVETGGRHRTYNEYVQMLEKRGFIELRLIKSHGEKHAIIGRMM